MTLASSRFTTKPGASAVSTAFLPRLARHHERRRQCGIRRLRRPHDLDERHDGDRVEEVEADETLGVRERRADLLDRQRRRVGREDRVLGDDLLDLAEHLLLDADLLEHRLDDEVAVRVLGLVGRAVHERAQPVGGVAVEAALRLELADLVVDVRQALVDARLVEVGDEHRHLQLAQEQQRELARHEPGADDADLGDLLRERLVGGADRALRALLHEVERVHGCRELVAGDEIGQSIVLAGEALGLRAALGLVEQLERGVRRAAEPCRCGDSSMPRAILIAIGHLVRRSILPGSFLRSTLTVPPSTPSAQLSESSR